FFQAEDGIRDFHVTGVQTCALPIFLQGFLLLRERIQFDETAGKALEEHLVEVRGAVHRVEAAMAAFSKALRDGGGSLEMVRWVEFRGAPRTGGRPGEEREGNVVLAAAPLDLGDTLRQSLWERIPTAVLTSATLATRDGFSFVRSRLGLTNELTVEEKVFPSPF